MGASPPASAKAQTAEAPLPDQSGKGGKVGTNQASNFFSHSFTCFSASSLVMP